MFGPRTNQSVSLTDSNMGRYEILMRIYREDRQCIGGGWWSW